MKINIQNFIEYYLIITTTFQLVFKIDFFIGAPKGIVHPHKNLSTDVRPTTRYINRAIISTIMFHLGGFLTPLIIGNLDYYY